MLGDDNNLNYIILSSITAISNNFITLLDLKKLIDNIESYNEINNINSEYCLNLKIAYNYINDNIVNLSLLYNNIEKELLENSKYIRKDI